MKIEIKYAVNQNVFILCNNHVIQTQIKNWEARPNTMSSGYYVKYYFDHQQERKEEEVFEKIEDIYVYLSNNIKNKL
jgi:hypothetical protein